MIFSELYSAYYNAVASIINAAIDHPLEKNEFRRIIEENTFGESILSIEPALVEERWQLINTDRTTKLQYPPSMPLTTLQKQWLQAISLDPRIRLFTDEVIDFDVKPLFTADDYYVFDKYSDGDPYEDESYIRNFRLILDAIKNHIPLVLDMINRKGNITHLAAMPEYLEYSEKDDKFRLITSGNRYGKTVNLGRIVKCKPYTKPFPVYQGKEYSSRPMKVVLELVDKRNALERVLFHFAHFEKEAVKVDDNRYRITISYDKYDETEIVIRILSFGPMVKVTAPEHFINLIKARLINQKSCGQ